MAVIETRILAAGVSGSAKGVDKGGIHANYRLSYLVHVDDEIPSPLTVLRHFKATAELPWIGDRFALGDTFDTSATVKAIDPELIEGSVDWFRVNVSFEPIEGEGDDAGPPGKNNKGEGTEDPLEEHDDIEVSFTQISVPQEFGTFRGFINARAANRFMKPGKFMAIQNSAGIAFDPSIEEEIDIKIIRITKNVPRYNGFVFNRYQGAVNTDAVVINKPAYNFTETFGPFFGKVKSIGAQYGIENKVKFYHQTLEIWVNPLGWRRNILDRGTDQRAAEGDRNASGGIISPSDIAAGDAYHRKILDADGVPIVSPVNLDGNGAPLDPKTPDPPVFSVWSTKQELPFMPLRNVAW